MIALVGLVFCLLAVCWLLGTALLPECARW
jgi:hypothetical protein